MILRYQLQDKSPTGSTGKNHHLGGMQCIV
jgi:hypothetical protein